MTTSEPLFRIPDDVQVLVPESLRTFVLPADPTVEQLNEAWDMQEKLDAEAGAWLRAAVREPESATFRVESACRIGAVSQALTNAVTDATLASVNFPT